MRVVAGEARGRKLRAPRGDKIRPTSDRVKEALFNILACKVPQSIFLDLYAGTGGIGIEALSRGCHEAFFVEKDPVAVDCIKRNLELTKLNDRAEIISMEVRRALGYLSVRSKRFDIIFLDPPYFSEPVKKEILSAGELLNEGGLLVLESNKNRFTEKIIGDLALTREEYYGDTKLSFYE